MLKRFLSIFLVVFMTFVMAGCSPKKVENKDTTLSLALETSASVETINGKYTGFVNDKDIPNKEGKFEGTSSKGKKFVYEGSFNNGHLEGKGKLTFFDGVMVQEGNFKNDKLNGEGKITLKSGKTITDKFDDGMRLYVHKDLPFKVMIPGRFEEVKPMFPMLLMQAADLGSPNNVCIAVTDDPNQKDGTKEYYDAELTKTQTLLGQFGAKNFASNVLSNSKGEPVMVTSYDMTMGNVVTQVMQVLFLKNHKCCAITYATIVGEKGLYVKNIEKTAKIIEYQKPEVK